MSDRISADICIIGAGSGGLSIAAGAAQLGRKVVLLEKGEMGGDCLNFGCIPSKALIAAASRAHNMRTAGAFGVSPVEPEIDFGAVMDHVHSVIAQIAPHDSQERFEGLGVIVIRAKGEFVSPRTIMAGDAVIDAKKFVIAAGSSPVIPPIPGIEDVSYFTNESIFENRARPEHLIVLGGGPIGIELAQAYMRLGARVSVVEADTILNRDDPDAVDVVRKALDRDGVKLYERTKVVSVSKSGSCVRIETGAGETIEGSHLLVAAGRRANLDGLGLEKAGVEFDGRNLKLNSRLQTTNKRIYAVGDVAGGMQFTHVAGDHASTAVRNILFKFPSGRRDNLAPRVTYCDPELASVGPSPREAAKFGKKVKIVRCDFADNDRARAERQTDGFLKAVIAENGRILGATIVGEGAGEEIGLWSFAIANNLKIKAMASYIAPYPTRGEISKRAGGAYFTPTLFSDRTRRLVDILSTFD
ncbi:MAG: FAD-dependent oxidoreductase [Parvularculaceae bacterium]|nr:FAD-dependent oxidoreductase [Parvularculaceae bacterium]